MNPVRVVIADDQRDVQAALTDLITADARMNVIGTASNLDEVVALCLTLAPDVVVMDIKMPGGGGAKATRLIRQHNPQTRVVAFSAYQDRATVLEMLSAGAIGYVTKGSPAADILAAIQRAADGLAVLSSEVSSEMVRELGDRLRAEQDQWRLREQRVQSIVDAIAAPVPMVFQPIVDLASGRIAGVEALARFPGDPTRTPDVWFADAAELDLGLGLESAAVMAAIAALEHLPGDMFLSVNVSPDAMVAPAFWDGVPSTVLSRLVIELTEHAPVHSYDRLHDAVRPLREQGARLAIDDAGAGFASLRHIVLLEADFIKIDASLTHNLHTYPARRAMASALISFAAETDAVVIAEGIEQHAECEELRRLGAAFGQGYLLAKPAELDALDLTTRHNGCMATRHSSRPTSVGRVDPERDQAVRAVDRMRGRLLRVATSAEAVALVIALVHDLGGRTQPASIQSDDVLPVDLTLGILSEAVVAAAAPGTRARDALDRHLSGCVEDVRAVVTRLDHGTRTARDASVDPLTGLLNRRATAPALRKAGVGDAVVMIDLDHFKQLNDTNGHTAGDDVLRAFGETLRRTTRDGDISGRHGGEEFLLVLPSTSLEAAVSVVHRIAAHWREDRRADVTFSAGVAAVDTRGPQAAVQEADAALYRAKVAGRNRIEAAPSAHTVSSMSS